MNNFIYLRINGVFSNNYIGILKNLKIGIYDLYLINDSTVIKIKYDDYNTFKKYFGYLHPVVIKYDGPIKYIKLLKNNIEIFITILLMILFIFICSNVIVDIRIESSNKILVNKIYYELSKNKVNKFTFKKNYEDLQKIKKNIKNELYEDIEWIEITKKGMIYIINVEPKIVKTKTEKNDYCNIVATKDAIITGIKNYSGNNLKNIGDYVNKGDLIIDGNVYFNDNIVDTMCADGEVYGEVWYVINISYPLNYYESIKTGKKSYNLSIEYNDESHQLLPRKYKNYLSDKKEFFDALGIKISYRIDYEIKKEKRKYSKKEALRLAIIKAEKSLNLDKNKGDKIIKEKVLQKDVKNSKIELEIFIVAQEQIGKQVILPKGETYDT